MRARIVESAEYGIMPPGHLALQSTPDTNSRYGPIGISSQGCHGNVIAVQTKLSPQNGEHLVEKQPKCLLND